MKVSVVCPFFNEGGIIESAIQRMRANLESLDAPWELLLVNDGSTDNSLDLARDYLTRTGGNNIVILSYPENHGRGHALKTGIDQASGEVIVTTEVDCSWGDAIVSRLAAAMNDHPEADVVIASPHAKGGGFRNVPLLRRFLSSWGNRLLSLALNYGLTMHTGMTRAYRKDVIQRLQTQEEGKEFHLDVLLKLVAMGYRLREIPATISWPDPVSSSPGKPRRKSATRLISTIVKHLRFTIIAEPNRYFGIAVLTTFLGGLALFILAVLQYMAGQVAIFYGLLGTLMLAFCLIFLGFWIVLIELRNASRERWREVYTVEGHKFSRAVQKIEFGPGGTSV